MNRKLLLISSALLLILLVVASLFGVFVEATYSMDTPSFATQAIGQDIVNLTVIAPLLLISTYFTYKNNRKAMFVWSGVIFYLIYTYAIFCFDQQFNSLFLVYGALFGLSFYSYMYFLLFTIKEPVEEWYTNDTPIKLVSVFLIIVAVLFNVIWLSEIIPALLYGEIPPSVIEDGTPTNPVHVLDLSLILPAFFITAIFLWKKNRYGYLLAPTMLMFLFLMGSAIIGMVITMQLNAIRVDIGLALIFIIILIIVAIITFLFLRKIDEGK